MVYSSPVLFCCMGMCNALVDSEYCTFFVTLYYYFSKIQREIIVLHIYLTANDFPNLSVSPAHVYELLADPLKRHLRAISKLPTIPQIYLL